MVTHTSVGFAVALALLPGLDRAANADSTAASSVPALIARAVQLELWSTDRAIREIARAFQIKGSDRIPLKALLRELKQDGVLERDAPRKLRPRGHLPAFLEPVIASERARLEAAELP